MKLANLKRARKSGKQKNRREVGGVEKIKGKAGTTRIDF